MTTRFTRRRAPKLAVAALAIGAAAGLAGCGSSDAGGAPPTPALTTTPSLSSFDLVVIASAENNPLFSDLYGITLNPPAATRITTGKRVSSMDANARQIVVAAADGPTDRLAFVSTAGELTPIPGLGRPFAYTPNFLPDGSVVFRDFVQPGDERVYRFRSWDSTTEKSTTLRSSKDRLFGLALGPGGSTALLRNNIDTDDFVVVRDDAGKQREFALHGDGGYLGWGRTYIAAGLNANDSRFGDKPSGLIFLDPDTGKQTAVPGWQPIAWTADGKKLLARSTTDPTSSELALIDPENPDSPDVLGTIPSLAIYNGAWVRGVR